MRPAVFAIALATGLCLHPSAFATPIEAAGSFSCDFLIDGNTDPFSVGEAIERDRQLMVGSPAADGFQHKVIPISFAADGMNLWAGGRYLFDTVEQAEAYEQFVKVGFVTSDGVQFLDRPMFLATTCYSWEVIGAEETAPVLLPDDSTTRAALRTERWRVQPGDLHAYLTNRWPAIRDEALSRGLDAVWLLYNEDERLVQLVYFSDRVDPTWTNPATFDFAHADWATYGTLAGMPPLGDTFPNVGSPGKGPWHKLLDRTDFTLTVWPLFVPGDQGAPSQWPNSGPFFAPFCGDGVCSPALGEDHDQCSADCSVGCGNAVCDPGETQTLCPGDCGV